MKYFPLRRHFCKQKVQNGGNQGGGERVNFYVIYRIGDDFSITAVWLSHRDYTDEREKEKERGRGKERKREGGERDAIFNRKRSRENNS